MTLDSIVALADDLNRNWYDDFDSRITEDTWQVFDSDETLGHDEVTLDNIAIGCFVFRRDSHQSDRFKLISSKCYNSHIQYTWNHIADLVRETIEKAE